MPHRFRPDQTQVVLDQDADGQRLIARCDPANPRAWCREPLYGALKGYAAKTWGTGKLVLAVAGRQTWVISPRGDIALGEVDPAATLKVVEGREAGYGVAGPENGFISLTPVCAKSAVLRVTTVRSLTRPMAAICLSSSCSGLGTLNRPQT